MVPSTRPWPAVLQRAAGLRTLLDRVAAPGWPVLAAFAVPTPGLLGQVAAGAAFAFALATVHGKPVTPEVATVLGLVLGIAASKVTEGFPFIAVAATGVVAVWVRRCRVLLGSRAPRVVDWALALTLMAVSVGACVLWVRLQAGEVMFVVMPDWLMTISRWFPLLTIVTLSAVNALIEETVWRHCLPQVLGQATSTSIAWLSSALSFGLIHVHALPFGLWGVLMTLGFGLVASWVNQRTASLLPSITAHLAADIVLLTFLFP